MHENKIFEVVLKEKEMVVSVKQLNSPTNTWGKEEIFP